MFRELAKDACKLGIISDKAKKFYLDIGEEIGKITGTLIKNRPDGKRKYKQSSGESGTSELSPEVKDPLMRMAAEHQNDIGADWGTMVNVYHIAVVIGLVLQVQAMVI